jgi:subtilisin family serine protease
MTLDSSRLLLAFAEPTSPEDVSARIQPFGLVLENGRESSSEDLGPQSEIVNHTDRRFWVLSVSGEAIDQERYQALQRELGDALEWIGPVYRLANTQGRGSLLCPIPNVLLLRPATPFERESPREFERRMRKFQLRDVAEKSGNLIPYRYFLTPDAEERNAYQLRDEILREGGELISDATFENMPMIVPIAVTPNDPLFPQQWSMTRIQAGGPGTTGWNISTGAPGIVVCVLDSGCDLTHPDLPFAPGAAGQGINLGTMMPTGAPTGGASRPHGTSCAGLAVGTFNNAAGIAGVGGGCRLMPVAFQNWTDAEVAAGINWAANNGASVISMSIRHYGPGEGLSPAGWNFAVINPAILNAVNVRGCVLVAATGNENQGVVNGYPARHPLVIGVGGSDQADQRKSPASADGECWGATFGPTTSVVAPCVRNPTTDIRGAAGYNTNNGGAKVTACVNYPVSGDPAGDYFFQFNGTSAATPHVAGLAGAIRGRYPALTNLQVRTLIERTADKVGGAYADVAGFPNGTRNAQMGYGRINMFRALDLADTMIKDWAGDTGAEPSTPPGGNFWTFSDIVVRITDDMVFNPADPTQSSNVERGQTNFLYIRVTNNGPREARNVVVSARITPYVGLEFVYPTDWTAVDANHVSPTPVTATFAAIPAGGTAMSKFTISAAQVEALWGWISGMSWHPCLLARVTTDNDYAFATVSTTGAGLVVRRNNLAQRNLSVINVLAGASVAFPLLAGSKFNAERTMEIMVDRSQIDRQIPLLLAIDDDGRAFPEVDLGPEVGTDTAQDDGLVFLERTRVEAVLGCCRGTLTLEKGSRFDCRAAARIGNVTVEGGDVILRRGKRYVEIRNDQTVVGMEKQPNTLHPLALLMDVPEDAPRDAQFVVSVSQRNESRDTVGGATVVYRVG